MQRSFTVCLVFLQLNDTVLERLINVDANLSDHDHVKLIPEIALLKDAFAFIIDSLVQLFTDVGECLSTVIGKEWYILLQVHPEVEILPGIAFFRLDF